MNKTLAQKERDILSLLSLGKTDLEVCRSYGLLPSQLESKISRASRLLDQSLLSDSDAALVERALRRRCENTIRSLEARFQALLDASPDAVLVINAMSGTIVQANDRASKLYGYEADELVGKSMEILVPQAYRGIHPAYRVGFLSSVRKRQMGYHPPIYAVKKNGETIELAVALTATLTDEDVMVVCTEFARWTAGQAICNSDVEQSI